MNIVTMNDTIVPRFHWCRSGLMISPNSDQKARYPIRMNTGEIASSMILKNWLEVVLRELMPTSRIMQSIESRVADDSDTVVAGRYISLMPYGYFRLKESTAVMTWM